MVKTLVTVSLLCVLLSKVSDHQILVVNYNLNIAQLCVCGVGWGGGAQWAQKRGQALFVIFEAFMLKFSPKHHKNV